MVKKIIGFANRNTFGRLRRLYDWTISWAHTPYGGIALFLVAFAESSFFPIPPDILLIALCISVPRKSFWLAFICSAGSVLGGMFGYFIGYSLYNSVGQWIIQLLHYEKYFEAVRLMYEANAFMAVVAAAFTPIPYKVFTIAAGFFKISFATLVAASAIGRSGRFFIVATLLYFFGGKIKTFIDRYFNLLTLAFFVLIVLGFIAVKYMF